MHLGPPSLLHLDRMTQPAMDPAETYLSVFLPPFHHSDSDGDFIIRFFCSIHEEDPALTKGLMAACLGSSEAPFTPREGADISLWFGLSFTGKPSFYHRKRLFSKTLAKVEISENAGYVLPCQLGETGC